MFCFYLCCFSCMLHYAAYSLSVCRSANNTYINVHTLCPAYSSGNNFTYIFVVVQLVIADCYMLHN
jgi:hypothetical protein